MTINGKTSKKGNRPSAKFQSGLSILEVLIALVILSVGLVGLAGMHMNSLQYVHSAYFRSLASSVALDLEERSWREISKTGVSDCLDVSESGLVFTSLTTDWVDRNYLPEDHWTGWGGEKQATMPTVDVDLTGATTTAIYSETPITISWSDVRFDSTEDIAITDESAFDESYDYNLRILCKLSTNTVAPSS